MKNPTITIDTDLGIDYADEGAWRSYEMTTHGDSLAELLENVTIAEIDQDGGELDCYGLGDASNEANAVVDGIIAREFVKALDELKVKRELDKIAKDLFKDTDK